MKSNVWIGFIVSVFWITSSIQNTFAQEKIKITKADDLPRRSVTLKGKAQEILKDDAQLQALNDLLIKNALADLEKYDIQDRATLKGYYEILMTCYFFKDDYEKALNLIPKVEELSDKKAEKLTVAPFLRTYALAIRQVKDNKSEAFKQIFTKEYANFWNSLPYQEVKDVVEQNKGSLSIFNPDLITASLDSQIQPYLDNNKNVVPEGIILNFTAIRLALDKRVHLVPAMLQVMTDLYEKNKTAVIKKDIWTDRDVKLKASDKGEQVIVAIWDSGVDMNIYQQAKHTDKNGKNGIGYSLVAYKNDGLLLENPQGKIKTDVKRLQLLTKGFMDLQAAIQSSEVDEVRKTMASLKKEQVKDFNEELSFYGLYAHGTHVAGIAIQDNPFAKLLAVRMGWDYHSLPPAHTIENAKFQAKMFKDMVKYLKENKVRVVNMSWRYSAAAYEGLLSLNGIGKNDEERKKMANEMFDLEKKALYEAFKSAPEILFICGSGNENNDANFNDYIPASFQDLPNLLTIGAVDNEGKKTSFTTTGKSVRFYANGFEVESFVPGGDRIKFSGTSMASPQVANLAAKILAINSKLTPQEVIAWIEKGSDNLPEIPELRLVNPKKTLQLLGYQTANLEVKKSLLKKWKPDANTAQLMFEDYVQEIKKLNDEEAIKRVEVEKDTFKQIFENITVEYKSDGTFELLIPKSPFRSGNWTFSQEDGKLYTKSTDGEEDFRIIDEITQQTMKITTSAGKKYTYLAQ